MPPMRFRDALGRDVVLERPPRRVVSLVPSDTFSLEALGAGERVVGCTRFCERTHGPGHQAATHQAATIVGGTKDIDVARIIELDPDLVVANQEENSRAALEALAERRIPLLVSLPRRVAEGVSHLALMARILGVAEDTTVRELLRAAYQTLRDAEAALLQMPPPPTVFIPIWRDPWMSVNDDTHGADVLRLACGTNVMAGRQRLYPLAADLGKQAAVDPRGRDQRYPRLSVEELQSRSPQLVMLPDEPYSFSAAEEDELRSLLPQARLVRCSGKDLFWSGAWAVCAIARVRALIQAG